MPIAESEITDASLKSVWSLAEIERENDLLVENFLSPLVDLCASRSGIDRETARQLLLDPELVERVTEVVDEVKHEITSSKDPWCHDDEHRLARHIIPAYAKIGEPTLARYFAQELPRKRHQAEAFTGIMEATGDYEDGLLLLEAAKEAKGDPNVLSILDRAAIVAAEQAGSHVTMGKQDIVLGIAELLWEWKEWGAAARTAIRAYEASPSRMREVMLGIIAAQPLTPRGLIEWGAELRKAVPVGQYDNLYNHGVQIETKGLLMLANNRDRNYRRFATVNVDPGLFRVAERRPYPYYS